MLFNSLAFITQNWICNPHTGIKKVSSSGGSMIPVSIPINNHMSDEAILKKKKTITTLMSDADKVVSFL
jgi:hypothetical protein